MKKSLPKIALHWLAGACLLASGLGAKGQTGTSEAGKMVGMYIHQHWSYNYPYAARTWTLHDWIGYIDGLGRLGYNTVVIWPMLETMPNPLTVSDSVYLAKIAQVIDTAQQRYRMKVYIVMCPNVAVKNEEATKYTFENRPFFQTDDRVDPADPVAFGKLMARREQLFQPLAAANGVVVIDSDPGGYPNATNLEYVYLLSAHRTMLDRLRPGIELQYWTHFGWEAYSRFYAEGILEVASQQEIRDVITLLAKQNDEPWGIWGSRYENDIVEIARSVGMEDRVTTFKYGAIEREPSFPFTLYNQDTTYRAGMDVGNRGIIGNAQTHAVQLPNTFMFARAARGLPATEADFEAFADDLVPGQGKWIVAGWNALQGDDPIGMTRMADRLDLLAATDLKKGPLSGLVFGNPARFVNDLALQLRAMGAICKFIRIAEERTEDRAALKAALQELIIHFEGWQRVHGFSGNPRSPHIPGKMEALMLALERMDNDKLNALIGYRDIGNMPGTPGPEKVKRYMREMETFTPRLIQAMKAALNDR